MKLSIVIPVYNEKKYIQEIVARVKKVNLPGIEKEIIIVDDYSTDGTRDILEKSLNKQVAQVLYHEQNMGKGAALRTGFQYAAGMWSLFRMLIWNMIPLNIVDYLSLYKMGKADAVYGSRFVGSEPHRVLFFGIIWVISY